MGFNSWNFYHCNIDENTVKQVLNVISTNGMKEAGYEYVNIDDCWQVERFPNGTIQPDPCQSPWTVGGKVVVNLSSESAAPRGFAAVFDANGVATLRQSYEHLAQTGTLVSTCAATRGELSNPPGAVCCALGPLAPLHSRATSGAPRVACDERRCA